MKLKAASLIYAIFIAFLLFSISSSFILYSFFHDRIIEKNDQYLNDLLDVKSAIQLGLSSGQLPEAGKVKVIQLYPDDSGSMLSLRKDNWGAFDIITAIKKSNDRKLTKSVLCGSIIKDPVAIYMADRNKALSIAGNTVINGPCFLPEAGTRRAFIEGKRFDGKFPESYLNLNSNEDLPSLNSERLEEIKNLLDTEFTEDSLVDYGMVEADTLIFNPWQRKRLVIYSDKAIRLENKGIRGRILIRSKREIHIQNCEVDGIICVAPKIKISEQKKGNMQVIASDSVWIKSSRLSYPSAIIVYDQSKGSSPSASIGIHQNSKIQGDVILFRKHHKYKQLPIISLDSNSVVTGLLYVNGNAEIKGEVFGSVYCEGFILKTPSSIYSNHLFDAVIDVERLPGKYISSIPFSDSDKQIIRWLN